MLIALMSVEKHQHSLISKITLAKAMFVQTMNLRVSEDVSHTLQVNDHHVALSELPREMA
jgi:hypothetical protein